MNDVRPNPLTDPVVPAITSIAIVCGVSSGVFELLSAEGTKVSSERIASKLALSAEGVTRLANVLVALGYLSGSSQGYELTPVSRETLLDSSSQPFRNWVQFSRYQIVAALEAMQVMRTGSPFDLFGKLQHDGALALHQRAMAETARPAADWVASQIPVPQEHDRMLDIGGSHGLYSAALCHRYPPMHSDVVELPEVIDAAKQVATQYETDQYCTYVPGDIRVAPLTRVYDVMFLGNVVHHFDEKDAGSVLEKLASHLNPGGVLALWDMFGMPSEPDVVSACFSFLFFVTSNGSCFAMDEIVRMLTVSGLVDIQKIRTPESGSHTLVTARKPRDSSARHI